MRFSTFIYKLTAKSSLKGNWQTPMLLLFVTEIFFTAASVLASVKIPNPYSYIIGTSSFDLYKYIMDIQSIPTWVWALFYGLMLLSVIISPMLGVSNKHYLLERTKGNETGLIKGLFGRRKVWLKAVWLYVRMYLQIFLWGLLMVIPGILAALRYSMAPFFLASNPDLSVSECFQKSKEMMKNRKGEFALLFVSFILWTVALNYGQIALSYIGLPTVLILVLAQFGDLALNVYRTATFSAYYQINTSTQSLNDALEHLRKKMNASEISREGNEQMEDFMESFSRTVRGRTEESTAEDENLKNETSEESKENNQEKRDKE